MKKGWNGMEFFFRRSDFIRRKKNKTNPNLFDMLVVLVVVMTEIEDIFSDLIHRCIKHDNQARKQLYEMFSSKMYSICVRYGSNKSQADDIFQESFLKVFENIGQVKNTAALPGWIKTIFVFTSLNYVKNEMKHAMQTLSIENRNDFFDHDILSDLTVQEITELIQKLPVKSRMVFNLYVIEGYNHKEIGDLMGISIGTSKSQLYDARENLKKSINKSNAHYLNLVI